jgi:hypothetical protein
MAKNKMAEKGSFTNKCAAQQLSNRSVKKGSCNASAIALQRKYKVSRFALAVAARLVSSALSRSNFGSTAVPEQVICAS